MLVSHFIRGKLIINGEDKSGFTTVGRTEDIDCKLIEKIVEYTSPRNTAISPIFSLTEVIDGTFRVFSHHFVSSTLDKNRGPFQMSHNILLRNENITDSISLVSLAKEIINYNSNRQFTAMEILQPLDVDLAPSDISKIESEDQENHYRNAALKIIDSLFHSPTIVFVSSDNPFFRLHLSELIYSLLPPALQNKLGIHTDVSASAKMKTIKSRLKYSSNAMIDSDGHDFLSIEPYDNNKYDAQIIKSQYVALLHNLLCREKRNLEQVVKLCRILNSENYIFSINDQKLPEDFKDLLLMESFQSIICNASSKLSKDSILFWKRNHSKFSKEENITISKKIIDYLLEDTELKFTEVEETISIMSTKLPSTFWDNWIVDIKQNPDRFSTFTSFLISNPITCDNLKTSSGNTITESWIDHLYEHQRFDQVEKIYNQKAKFPKTKINEIYFLQYSITYGFDNNETISKLLNKAFYANGIKEIKQIITCLILTQIENNFPILAGLLRKTIYEKGTFSLENILEKLEKETDRQMFNWTGLLCLHLGCKEFINRNYFVSILDSEDSEIQEIFATLINYYQGNIYDDSLGALYATLFLLKKTISNSLFLSNQIKNYRQFIKGLHFIIISSKNNQYWKEDQIKTIVSQLANIKFITAIEFCTTLAEISDETIWKVFALKEALFFYKNLQNALDIKVYGERLMNLHKEISINKLTNQEIVRIVQLYLNPVLFQESEFHNALDYVKEIFETKLAIEVIINATKELLNNRRCVLIDQKNSIWISVIFWITQLPIYQEGQLAENVVSRILDHIQFSKLTQIQLGDILNIGDTQINERIYIEEIHQKLNNPNLTIKQKLIDIEFSHRNLGYVKRYLFTYWHPQNKYEVTDLFSILCEKAQDSLVNEIKNKIFTNEILVNPEIWAELFLLELNRCNYLIDQLVKWTPYNTYKERKFNSLMQEIVRNIFRKLKIIKKEI